MTYLEQADIRFTKYIADLHEVLTGILDGNVDNKEVSDSLGILEELQEEFSVISNDLKTSDELLGNTI